VGRSPLWVPNGNAGSPDPGAGSVFRVLPRGPSHGRVTAYRLAGERSARLAGGENAALAAYYGPLPFGPAKEGRGGGGLAAEQRLLAARARPKASAAGSASRRCWIR